jgi:serine/threonine protein kinase
MHFKNIIHRDIKAENLLLNNVIFKIKDVVKLCDFGWSA